MEKMGLAKGLAHQVEVELDNAKQVRIVPRGCHIALSWDIAMEVAFLLTRSKLRSLEPKMLKDSSIIIPQEIVLLWLLLNHQAAMAAVEMMQPHEAKILLVNLENQGEMLPTCEEILEQVVLPINPENQKVAPEAL